jgi:hypothetical protein
MTPKQRILRILKWNYNRGINKESVNEVYRKLLKDANYYQNQFKVKDYKK